MKHVTWPRYRLELNLKLSQLEALSVLSRSFSNSILMLYLQYGKHQRTYTHTHIQIEVNMMTRKSEKNEAKYIKKKLIADNNRLAEHRR